MFEFRMFPRSRPLSIVNCQLSIITFSCASRQSVIRSVQFTRQTQTSNFAPRKKCHNDNKSSLLRAVVVSSTGPLFVIILRIMPDYRLPSPTELTTSQKSDLRRLWEVQSCTIQDVRPTCESKSSGDSKKAAFDDHGTIRMMTRLHDFFLAFLKNVSNETSEKDPFLKNVEESCLEPYVRLFLGDNGRVVLRGGRRTFTLHYDEITAELNRFEFQGDAPRDVIRNDSFGAFLHHFPLKALPAVNAAMALAVTTLWRAQREHGDDNASENSNAPPRSTRLDRFFDTCQNTVRFIHVSPLLPMADIKTGLVHKFISVKGNVVKARPKRLRVATADFSCQKCSATITYAFDQGRFSLPTKCSSDTCRSRSFTLMRPTARYTNVQVLRLQEAQEESTAQAGRTPRQLEVELTDDLIDSCRPGDIVLLACYVDAVNSAVAAGRAGKRAQETSTYKLFLQGHSITTLSETNNRGQKKENVVYTQQQLQNITQLCHADHRCLGMIERRAFPFDLLVRSLCPSIIGHHVVKAGILLCLLGGTPPNSQQADRGSTIRSNSHILIVGDPGTKCGVIVSFVCGLFFWFL